jgi:hypothetical protein
MIIRSKTKEQEEVDREMPESVLVRNLDSRVDPETLVNSAMYRLLSKISKNGAHGANKRYVLGMAALACDYFEYSLIETGGQEFSRFYERHTNGTQTKRDDARKILRRFFETEIKS